MISNTDKLKLIFGLKIRQLRQDKGINLSSLAEKANLSVSYLNEIESGKKYPKFEKIVSIAEALDVEYDTIVSMKLNKQLEPVAELLNSTVLEAMPLEMFGIELSDLVEVLAKAPARFSAFINTIIEISRSYEMSVENFFFSALRSYQELHDNYFVEIEEAAQTFVASIENFSAEPNKSLLLRTLLETQFGYKFNDFDSKTFPQFSNLRSAFLPNDKNLLVNKMLSDDQRAFTFGRELGYQYLKIEHRPLISPALEAESFEQMLNNFKASYFAGALLMPQKSLAEALLLFFKQSEWDNDAFLSLMTSFQATPEMFLQRITNIMKSNFDINQLFFIRFDNQPGQNLYYLSKELHLAKLHNPHATVREHYCRRWVSITILDELAEMQKNNSWDGNAICRVQISEYDHTDNRYLVISFAKSSPPRTETNSSVSIGLAIDENLTGLMRFLNDPKIIRKTVGETCERCAVQNCLERAVPAIVLQKQAKIQEIKNTFDSLNVAH